jgi:predicted phosphodiesterase
MRALVLLCLLAPVASADTWKFMVSADTRSSGGDNGVNTTILGEIANRTVAEGAEFILVPGDLALSATTAAFNTWKSTMQPVYNAGIGVYAIRGNHDTNDLSAWNAAFYADMPHNGPAGEIGLTYSFTRHNALIVGMDEYVTSHRVNQAWLDQQFATNAQPLVFVFGHEPAFKVYHTDNLDNYSANRDAFWSSIRDAGGRSYFCGHDHLYDQAGIDDGDGNPYNNVRQMLIGNGGAPFYNGYSYNGANTTWTPTNVAHDENNYGYVLVEVNDNSVTMTYKHRTSAGVYEPYGTAFSYTAVEGDANHDGIVDLKDYATWFSQFNQTDGPTWLAADFNHDGVVDLNDYATWFNHFNMNSGASPVPEPSSLAVMAVACAVAAMKRRRRA